MIVCMIVTRSPTCLRIFAGIEVLRLVFGFRNVSVFIRS